MFTKQNTRKLFLYIGVVSIFIFGFFNFYTRLIHAQTTGSGSVSVTVPTGISTAPPYPTVTINVSGSGGAIAGSTTFTLVPSGAPTYTVTCRGGSHGTISPVTQTVVPNSTTSCLISPDNSYYPTVTGCGSGTLTATRLPHQYIYTTAPVTGNCTVNASFTTTVPPSSPAGTITANPMTCTLPCAGGSALSWSTSGGVTSADVYVNGIEMQPGASGTSTIPSSWISTTPLVFNLYDTSSGSKGALLSSTSVTGTNTSVSCTNGATQPCSASNSCDSLTNSGNQTCENGSWGACDATVPSEASCGVCTNGATQPCSASNSCDSLTNNGNQTCQNNSWGACDATVPSEAVCDIAPSCGVATNVIGYEGNLGNFCAPGAESNLVTNNPNDPENLYYSWDCSTNVETIPCASRTENGVPLSASISANPSVVYPNNTSTLTLGCSGGDGSGYQSYIYDPNNPTLGYINVDLTQPYTTYPIPQYSTFMLECADRDNPNNDIINSTAVSTDSTLTPTPTGTLTANPTSIYTGESSTLTWSSTNATTCTGTNFSTGGSTSGSLKIMPSSTLLYTLTCDGTQVGNTTVTVKHKPGFTEN